MSSSKNVEPLDLDVLDNTDEDQDSDEPPVVPEVIENVEISLSYLSAVDLVKHLQEYEGSEDNGE